MQGVRAVTVSWTACRDGGTGYAMVSNTIARKGLWVRIPLPALGLRSDDLVELFDIQTTRNSNRLLVGPRPMDAERLCCPAEDLMDIRRDIGELVTRIALRIDDVQIT